MPVFLKSGKNSSRRGLDDADGYPSAVGDYYPSAVVDGYPSAVADDYPNAVADGYSNVVQKVDHEQLMSEGCNGVDKA